MQRIFMGPSPTTVSGSNQLNCTANDISLARARNVSQTSCTKGVPFTLTATFDVVVTANARYDAGFFFRTDPNATTSSARGDGPSAGGDCTVSWLDPNSLPATNLDRDGCGDLNAGTYQVTVTIPNLMCQAYPGTDQLWLPNCTSWHSNSSTACTAPASALDAHVYDFHPETKSKCKCDDAFTVPVTVEEATITVDKSASPANVPEPGGEVTYTIQITNTASIESVKITSILDNVYGDLGALQSCAANQPPPACTPPSVISCPSLINTTLAAGDSATCSFKGFVSGNANQTITDKVEVCGIQPSLDNRKTCGHDEADVLITDVSTKPGLDKKALSAACTVDVTYQVVVSNNSLYDTLTVNSLTDDMFGDITIAHAAGSGFGQVVSTSCSLPKPAIDPLGNLTCSFVGRTSSSTCNFTLKDTVTGTATDDDSVKYDKESGLKDDATVTVVTTFP